MKLFITSLAVLLPSLAFAAEGLTPEVKKSIMYQAINVGILIAAVIYFGREGIKKFFADRRDQYLDAAKKSEAARLQAEKDFAEIKAKLANLDATKTETLVKAEKQAQEIKEGILKDALAISERIRQDAKLTADLEIQRAQRELREQLLKDSVNVAREALSKNIESQDQQKLQNNFINHVGV